MITHESITFIISSANNFSFLLLSLYLLSLFRSRNYVHQKFFSFPQHSEKITLGNTTLCIPSIKSIFLNPYSFRQFVSRRAWNPRDKKNRFNRCRDANENFLLHAYRNEICVVMHTLRTLLDESSYVTHANPHFISCGLRARLRNTTSRRSTICNTCAMTFRRSVVVTDVKFRLFFLFVPTWNSGYLEEFFHPQFSDK